MLGMRWKPLPALVASSLLWGTHRVRSPTSHNEWFPTTLDASSSSSSSSSPSSSSSATTATATPLILAGTGVRSKTVGYFMSFPVYALGLYVEPSTEVVTHIVRQEDTDTFIRHVLEDCPGDKVIRLVMLRDVESQAFMEALQLALEPRVQSKTNGLPFDSLTSCATFKAYFSHLSKLQKGDELVFRRSRDGKLASFYNGDQLGLIQSSLLCESLFDVWLGSKPIAPKAKNDLIARLAFD